MKFRGAPEPWVSGLSNMINLQALKYAENAAKSDIFTEKDAAKIERQMMRELAKKGLAFGYNGSLNATFSIRRG